MRSIFFLVAILLITASACKETTGGSDCNFSFDQTALFTNLADELILPGYASLKSDVDAMKTAGDAFVATPTLPNLEALQTAWLQAYLQWQTMAQYEFGPAEEVFLRNSVNNFPLNVDSVEAVVASGSYNFDQPDRFDKGFPALDYLLYGLGNSNADVLTIYQDPMQGSKYAQYLAAVLEDIQMRVNHTYDGWSTGYADEFIANTGTAAGSSLSLIVNNLNQHYELIKREKLGVPSGVLTLGIANPERVEAYYSGKSKQLAVAALTAARQLYEGKSAGGANGQGLDDFLTQINAQKNNASLNEIILQQFATAISTVSDLDEPLSLTAQTNQSALENAYNEVSKQVVNIKTDMPSVLCVSITYIDNPSDSD